MDLSQLPLRKRIASLIINENGLLLIVLVKGRDIWTSLGGGMEEGETPEECLTREIKEEVGLTATSVNYFVSTPIELAAGSTDKAVQISFYLVEAKGEIRIDPNEAIEDYRWISAKDFDEIKKGNSIKIGSGLEFYAIPKLIENHLLK